MGNGEQGLGIADGSGNRKVGEERGITCWEHGVRAGVGTEGQGVGAGGGSGAKIGSTGLEHGLLRDRWEQEGRGWEPRVVEEQRVGAQGWSIT